MALRRGVITPVVLMVLAIFAILGVTFLFTGSSEYSQSALALYGLKAQLLAQAALEETQAYLYQKINKPPIRETSGAIKHAEWKQSLLKAVEEAVKSAGSNPTGTVKFKGAEWTDLKESLNAKTLAGDVGFNAELTRCEVRFHGFRKFPYPAENKVYSKDTYYANKLLDGELDQLDEAAMVPNDYIGYYTIRAAAKVRGRVRTVCATHDIKLVNCHPIAREFALYQMTEVQGTDQQDNDLNKGGGFQINAHGHGRVYMRGPYTVETEGFPGGEGGGGPQDPDDANKVASNSHRPFYGKTGWNDTWVGWQPIPNPRAGILKGEFTVLDPPPQTRPKKVEASFTQSVLGAALNKTLLSIAGSSWTHAGVDPALFIRERSVWYTGFRELSEKGADKDKDFCLFGHPRSSPPFWTIYRGIMVRLDGTSDTKKSEEGYWPVEDLVNAGQLPQDPAGKGDANLAGQVILDPDRRWSADAINDRVIIVPEANLKGKYRVVQYLHPGVDLSKLLSFSNPFVFVYRTEPLKTSNTPEGVAMNYYGLHWEGYRSPKWYERLGDAAGALLSVVTYGAVFNFVSFSGFFQGSGPVSPDGGQEVAKASMPTNFKSYARAATRVYSKASNIRSIKNGSTLELDGVLWAKELRIDKPFTYAGIGVLGAKAPPESASNAEGQVVGPIVPKDDRDKEMDNSGFYTTVGQTPVFTPNYLTLFYQGESGNEKEKNAKQMLAVKFQPASADAKVTIDGTVYATHGVRPESPLVYLEGNYVCGVLNKSKSAKSNYLVVHYNLPLLSKPKGWLTDQSAMRYHWNDGDWHTIAISPKVTHYYDKEQ